MLSAHVPSFLCELRPGIRKATLGRRGVVGRGERALSLEFSATPLCEEPHTLPESTFHSTGNQLLYEHNWYYDHGVFFVGSVKPTEDRIQQPTEL